MDASISRLRRARCRQRPEMPTGQLLTRDFYPPVLSDGPTPKNTTGTHGRSRSPRVGNGRPVLEGVSALPAEESTSTALRHEVRRSSGRPGGESPIDTLLADRRTSDEFTMVQGTAATHHVPPEESGRRSRPGGATSSTGKTRAGARRSGPAARAAPVFWKSAKWVNGRG